MLQLLGDGDGIKGAKLPKVPRAKLEKAFRTMLLVRTLDTRLTNLQRQGRIGFYGACTGQEATPIGTAMALRDEDWVFPALREGSCALYRGYRLSHYVAQCLGNDHDLQKGRQMPCHYMDRGVHHVSWSSVIATQILHAAGAAYAMKFKGKDTVTIGFLGDGATSENDFHSALNFAAVTKSPVVFVCQNNQFAISVSQRYQTATETYHVKAKAYGMPGVRVDGNDILAVYAAISEAAERARKGEGPTFIEAVTYRITPHSSSDDPTRYRDEAEFERWKRRDPLLIFRRHLEKQGIWTQAWEKEMQKAIDGEVDAAIKKAESEGLSAPETMFDDVYEEVPPLLQQQRARLLQRIERGEDTWPPQHP
jgi:pyruvate dehydrogenase E1 component alpha subunit